MLAKNFVFSCLPKTFKYDLDNYAIRLSICNHSYLPTHFGGLVDNALVYISGFVVRKILKKLSCEVCRASLVTAAVPSSFDQSYHLLKHKNNGGVMIPSEGIMKVVRAAERMIRQNSKEQGVSVSFFNHFVRVEICSEDVFLLGEHIAETQFGIENHQFMLVSFVVSVFHKVRLHHIAKLTILELQSASICMKLCKTVIFQGF